jgi:hypothetical protein
VSRARRLLLGALGIAVGLVAVLAMREATLSTHQAVPPDSRIELIVDARVRNTEANQTIAEMVEAHVLTCRLEVTSDVVGSIEDEGDGRFRAVLTPSMDETNRRQFRGCLEDWVHDQLLVDVVRLEQLNS